MKKILVVMMLTSIISMSAQAEIYGSIKNVIKLVNSSNDGAENDEDQNLNPIGLEYIIGVQGTKSLGRCLTVGYKISITGDVKNNDTFKKDSAMIGIANKFGTIFIGNMYAATKIATHYMKNSTSSWDKSIGAIENIDQNGIRYQSPNMAGFVINVSTGSNSNNYNSNNDRDDGVAKFTGFALKYTNVGFKFTYGYQMHDANEYTDTEDRRTAMTLGYSVAGFSGIYSMAVLIKELSLEDEHKTNANGVTLSYKFGANQFLAGLYNSVKKYESNNKYGHEYISVKYVYNFSKDTTIFIENMDTTATENNIDTASLIQIGAKHNF